MRKIGKRRCILAALAVIVIVPLVAVALTWGDRALPGDDPLPPKFADWRMPDVEANIAALLRPDAPLPLRALTDETGTPITEAEGVALGPGGRYAARLRFANPDDAQFAAEYVDFGGWKGVDGDALSVTGWDEVWGLTARTAWARDERVSWEEREPAVWRGWSLLPDDPPAPPVAFGFVRNRSDLTERMLREAGLSAGSLGSALGFARVDVASFAVYGEMASLPYNRGADFLRDADIGVLAVAESGYPGIALRLAFGALTSRSGFARADVDGQEAYHRAFEERGVHLMMTRYGRTIYAAMAQSKDNAEALVRSVEESQRSRR